MELDFEAAELPADAIEVGRIVGAWGIKGWFKVFAYSGDPEAVFSSKRWLLQPSIKNKSPFEGTVKLNILESKDHSDSIVARAEGVSTPEVANELKGARIFVPRSSFPSTALDEYYWVDLIGLSVINRDNLNLGVVIDLISTGPQTVLVLTRLESGKTIETMIPFVNAYIDSVDLQEKHIRVDWGFDY
jgi:16S rRNA processing protein RimM